MKLNITKRVERPALLCNNYEYLFDQQMAICEELKKVGKNKKAVRIAERLQKQYGENARMLVNLDRQIWVHICRQNGITNPQIETLCCE